MRILATVILALSFMMNWAASASAHDEHEGAGPSAACRDDKERFCKDVEPGGGRIMKCMKEHEASLSAECREQIAKKKEEWKKNHPEAAAKMKERMKESKEACQGDIDKFCKDVKPGEGRIMRCLHDHKEEISDGCRGSFHHKKAWEKAEKKKKAEPQGD